MESEGRILLSLAETLQYPADSAYSIIVGVAQAGGFHTDIMLNQITGRLREAFGNKKV